MEAGLNTSNSSISSWVDSCQKAAVDLSMRAKDRGLPLVLCLSGSIKSQALLAVFQAAGVPFRALVVRYTDGANANEIDFITARCREFGIPVETNFLNFDNFLHSGEALALAKRYRCAQAEFLLAHCLLEWRQGFLIFGYGLAHLERGQEPGYIPGLSKYAKDTPWYRCESSGELSLRTRVIREELPACVNFFAYSERQGETFLALPLLRDLIENRLVGKLTARSSLARILSAAWPLEPLLQDGNAESIAAKIYDFNFYLANIFAKESQVFKFRLDKFVAISEKSRVADI